MGPHGLKAHCKAKHEGVRYACDQCEYKATQKVNLRTHISTVHGKNTFSCIWCYFKGKSKSYVLKHIRRVHKTALNENDLNNSDILANLVSDESENQQENNQVKDEIYTDTRMSNIVIDNVGEDLEIGKEVLDCKEINISSSLEIKLDVVANM